MATRPKLAGAVAALAGPDRGAGLGSVAAAVLAGADDVELDLAAHAFEHVFEFDLDRRSDIGARRRTAAAEALPAAEEGAEQVVDRAEALGLRGEAARAQAVVAVAVVGGALVFVGEHLVGLGDLLELLFGLGVVAVDVRVEFPGDAAERLLDLGLVGATGNPEHLVVVALAHV